MVIRVKDASNFKQHIAKSGHTQETYAEKMNISFSHLNKAINGKKNVGAKLAGRIQKDFKAKFDELFIIEEEEQQCQSK